ncbi:hypothetical protein IAT38_001393 [Cryptococcus sp. DSM 104549]
MSIPASRALSSGASSSRSPQPPRPTQDSLRKSKHKTLSAYYPVLLSISSLLSALLASPLTNHQDEKSYHDLVNGTICAFHEEEDLRRIRIVREEGGERRTQQEVIDGVLKEISAQKKGPGNPGNVLVVGDMKVIEDFPFNHNKPGIASRPIHNPSETLRGRPWQLLRARIGDQAFHQLLIHASIFMPVGNNCFMQLTGAPISALHDKKRTSEKVLALGKRKRKEGIEKGARKRARAESVEGGERAGKSDGQRDSAGAANPANINIARHKMWYSKPPRSSGRFHKGLPPKHILNTIQVDPSALPTDSNCVALLTKMFPSLLTPNVEEDGRPTMKGSRARLNGMIGIARDILVRHNLVDYGAIARRCLVRTSEEYLPPPPLSHPIVSSSQPITQVPPSSPSDHTDVRTVQPILIQGSQSAPLEPKTHNQVCWYVATVLKEVFSPISMGSKHNFDALLSHTRRFIKAKQHEPITLHSLLQGLRVNDFEWLAPPAQEGQRAPQGEMKMRAGLVQDLVKWLFDDFLVPLLQNTFYATETAVTKYETVYYLQEDWARATRPHFEKLQATLLKELSSKRKKSHATSLGASAVRLIPKPTGFRPIVNLGRKIKRNGKASNIKYQYTTANAVLKPVHQVLSFEKERRKATLGGALFGTNEIFTPVQNLKRKLLAKHGRLPKLYFVKMDIKAAFDSINQEKMLEIVEKMLDADDDYTIMSYALLLPPGSGAYAGTVKNLYKSLAIPDGYLTKPFSDHAKSIVQSLRNAVVVDNANRQAVTRNRLMELLRTHIRNNIWQIGKKFYRQKTGIPQGSKVSSLLCSIFYSYLENEHLAFTRGEGSLLLRYIDDFLYVATDPNSARRFVDVMQRGFPEYGAHISRDKTLLNFEYDAGGQMMGVCEVDAEGESYFPYCGYLINVRTLDIMPDYQRYLACPVKQSFARRSDRKSGASFVTWLSRQLENRNQIAYLDTVHNKLDTVLLNVYLNFATTAMKVPYYFKTSDPSGAQRDRLIYDSLSQAAEYTYLAGRARVRHSARKAGYHPDDHYAVYKPLFLFVAKTAMSNELRGRAYKGMAERYAGLIEKGREAIKVGKY